MTKPVQANRPLAGVTLGISISESESSDTLGFNSVEVNRCAVRLSEILLGHGAKLVFAHDWRSGGVMESIAMLAQRYQPLTTEPSRPSIFSYVCWPDKPALDKIEGLRSKLSGILEVRTVSLPLELEQSAENPNARAVLRAVALRSLRTKVNAECDARICLGGRVTLFQGWIPGIVEEALIAIACNKPVYLAGILGGATEFLIRACKNPSHGQQLFAPSPDLVAHIGKLWPQRPDFGHGAPEGLKLGKLPKNGLSRKDQEFLFNEREIDDVTVLILKGLFKLIDRGQLRGQG